jgi:hypothetical protein
MEFPFRTANVSTLAHVTEDEQKVLKALRALLPEGIEVQRKKLKGHHGNLIFTFIAPIKRRRLVREFWKNMIAKLRAGELDKLSSVLPERIDETCHLYLRFDKQLAYGGELALTESGDALHVKLKVTAYPAKRDVATKLVREFIADAAPVTKLAADVKT